MPKVSVIVPVHNSRDYISACLDSLVEQTLDDMEIVLVDDRGRDDSLQIIQTYLTAYEGGKQFVITQTAEGKGPGAARNTGIACASGEYVAFLDSDDLLEPEFCERLYNAAAGIGADLAFCDISFEYPGGISIIKTNPKVESGPIDEKKKKKFLSRGTAFFTTFIYKKSFLSDSGISFPLTRCAEDKCFLACCILCAGSIASVGKPLYRYLIYQDSVSKKKDRKRHSQRLESFRLLKSFAKERGLYRQYRCAINSLCLKQGTLRSWIDYLKNRI